MGSSGKPSEKRRERSPSSPSRSRSPRRGGDGGGGGGDRETTQKKKQLPGGGLAIQLNTARPSPSGRKAPTAALGAVASAFVRDGDSSSSGEEEMPQEAKLRMRNVGRQTITSSGPNSFGKTKLGFCDANKLFERSLADKKGSKN